MMNHVRKVLLCPPATTARHPNALRRPCSDCGRELWVETKLIGHVDTGTVEAICTTCAHTELTRCAGATVGVLPEQEQEFGELGINPVAGQDVLHMDRQSSAYRALVDAIGKLARDER